MTPPTLTAALPTLTGIKGSPVTYSASVFQDPAGLALSYTYTGLPAGLSGNPTSVAITGTPTNPGAGSFTVIARNTAGLSTPAVATWSITEVSSPTPNPPTLTAPLPTLTATKGSPVTYSASVFQDPAGLALSYTYTGLPAGLSGNPTSVAISGTPTSPGAGAFTVTARNTAGLSTPAVASWSIADVPSSGGALTMLTPTYNCATGAITFRTSGGNGTTIEYMAAGITGWTTNPNQFLDRDARVASDTPPFTLYARQGGTVVSASWSRQQTCSGSARKATAEQESWLLYPNPVEDVTTLQIPESIDPATLRLSLFTLLGSSIDLSDKTSIQQQTIQIRFPENSLQVGLYILKVDGAPKSVPNLRLLKR